MATTKVAKLEGQSAFKLSKKSWLGLAIGVLAIALFTLGGLRSQQMQQESQLQGQLTLTQSKTKGVQLEQLSQRQAELERQLSQNAAQSQTARAVLSQPIDSIALSSTLFDIAKSCRVIVIEISSPGITSTKLEGITFTTLTVTTKLEGEIADLISFTTNLNNKLPTGYIKSAAISAEGNTEGEKPTATIQVVMYSSKGG